MSESEQVKANPGTADPPATGGEPSMEDILASIRRILAEEEGIPPATQAAAPPASPPASSEAHPAILMGDGVLQLDASMMLPDPIASPAPEAPPASDDDDFSPPALVEPPPFAMPSPSGEVLLAPETAEAAATSVGSLVRTLAIERATQVYGGGPTLEDMVRGELRPLLKRWLDENLPGMVERLVRAEIERVVARAAP
jgi:cell pole-organizing protein PopZ